MNQAFLEEVINHPDSSLLRFTVEQYQRLLDDGVLADGGPYELLDGYIFHKNRADLGVSEMIHSPRHSHRLAKLNLILQNAATYLGLDLYCQLPLQLAPFSVPEPDFCLAVPLSPEAMERHLEPGDVVLTVEVALSSLKRDREGKLPLYAKAGVSEYWIVNLADLQLEIYRQPDRSNGVYHSKQVLRTMDRVTITGPNGKTVELPVGELL